MERMMCLYSSDEGCPLTCTEKPSWLLLRSELIYGVYKRKINRKTVEVYITPQLCVPSI